MNQNIDFHKPTRIKEAADILKSRPNAIPLAGGTDLIVKFRSGIFPNVTDFVDLSLLGLNKILDNQDTIEIQSGCTMTQIINNDLVKEYFPVLVEAAGTVGAPQIRNSATIGGNSGNASPAGDTIPALYSLDAKIKIDGSNGERTINISDFFKGPGKTALKQGEIIKSFIMKKERTTGTFLKLGERKAHAISKINIAISKVLSDKPSFRIAFGSVAPTILRCHEAEEKLANENFPLSEEALEELAAMARNTAKPIDDVRSTQRYRKQMAGVLIKRALQKL